MSRENLVAFTRKVKDRILDACFNVLMRPAEHAEGRAPFNVEELKLLRLALLNQNLCCIGGQMVPAFEKEFAYRYGVPYAVGSTSGTAAIHVALGALNLSAGDEVITAPITDLGTIIPILYQNAIPVFADVDNTYNMDPKDVERKITSRTRAIIAVHLFGNPCDMDAMVDIARRHKIPLIEDCSQAHLAEYKGKMVGSIGDIGCFSFQQSKHMTTGDGGMTITGNKDYYERMKLFADKGFARKGWGARAYLFHAPNYRMTELVGAVGLAQLKKVGNVVNKRRELGLYMTELLKNVSGIRTAPITAGATSSFWLYAMGIEGLNSQLLVDELRQAKLPVSLGYIGKPIYLCTESLSAKKTYGDSQCPFDCGHTDHKFEYKEGLCPHAESLLDNLITIGIDESWTRQEVQRVAGIVTSAIKKISTATPQSSQPVKSSTVSVSDRPVVKQPAARKTADGIMQIGIIGCGQMGRWHLDSFKQNSSCKVVGVVDTDFGRAQQFAQEVGATAYRSHTEMIAAQSLNGVSICTVPSTHKNIVLDVLDAGIDVLCEKPLAVSVSEAQQMLERATKKNRLLLTAFKFRFRDEVVRAKELIDKRSLGNIIGFRLMFGGYINMAGTWYAQESVSGGGVIMDNGPHSMDLVRFLFGDVRNVTAHAHDYQNLGVEDTAQLSVCLQNGITGTMDLSWSSRMPAANYLEIYGEDGSAFLNNEGITYRFKTWSDWKKIPNDVDLKAAFARQIDHFVAALTGTRPSRVENIDGLRTQVAIEAAYESLRQDRKVEIQDFSFDGLKATEMVASD